MKKCLLLTFMLVLFGLSSTIFAQSYIFSRNLQVGSLGQDVTNLQTWLISNGYDIPAISSGVAVKGYFGTQTKLAVQKYQIKLDLPPTGFVGPLTRGKLNDSGLSTNLSFNPVSSNDAITITDPQAAEILYRGTTKTIRWTTQGSPSLVSIYLYKYSDPVLCPAGYSCMPVAPVHYLIEQIPNPSFYNNQYDWLVGTATQVAPEKNTTKYPENGKYFVRICRDETGVDNATGKCDSTDSYITIATDTTCPKGYVCMNKSN